MPQKTKKQKLRSLQHRHQKGTRHTQTHAVEPEKITNDPVLPTFSFKRTAISTNSPASVAEKDTLTYLRGDLLKTVILAIVCCGVVVGLSFVLK